MNSHSSYIQPIATSQTNIHDNIRNILTVSTDVINHGQGETKRFLWYWNYSVESTLAQIEKNKSRENKPKNYGSYTLIKYNLTKPWIIY